MGHHKIYRGKASLAAKQYSDCATEVLLWKWRIIGLCFGKTTLSSSAAAAV